MSNIDDLARALLPPWPPRDVEAIYSTIPEPEPKAWASQFGTDFLGAWEACPESDWLIIFALVVSSGCGESTKARVADAMVRALGIQDQIPPSKVATVAEREALTRLCSGDPAGIGFFRNAGGGMQPRPDAEVLRELRSSLDARQMLRESMLVP